MPRRPSHCARFYGYRVDEPDSLHSLGLILAAREEREHPVVVNIGPN